MIVKRALSLITFVIFMSAPVPARAQQRLAVKFSSAQPAFKHPGMAQQGGDLELMRQRVRRGEEPWKSAFERLKQEVESDRAPIKGVTHLSQGPYGADDFGGKLLDNNAKSAYNNALMYYITRDRSYAQKTIQILNTWSATLWDFDDNNAKLLAGLTGHYLLNAAELMRYTGSGWRPLDIERFKQFMLTVYYPLIYDFFPQANGNWDASMINTMLCIGVFCDSHEIFNRAIDRFYWGAGNGGITKYIYPGGQIQETSRDWGHVQLGIGEFAKAAAVAWSQGVDLYGAAGNRLAEGFEYAARYMLGEEVPVYGKISTRERLKFRDIYETIYEHYHQYSGLDMRYTERVVQRTRPSSALVFLTSTRFFTTKTTLPSLTVQKEKILRGAGALPETTGNPPAGFTTVKPGQSVQKALDACSGRSCWVILEKGVHLISEPLRLPDSVTLAGMGKESILMLDPKTLGKTVINATDQMHNVTLRDFLIEGATTVSEGEDPNNNRRIRANQNAPSREGIVFSCNEVNGLKNLQLIHLTVQNFTKNGVAIKGAAQVRIDSCDFSGNGSSVVPGPGIHHNLLITHATDCKIENSRLDDSPWGSGLMILLADHVSVVGCELARNKMTGLSCRYSNVLDIRVNLTEGNDADGINVEPSVGVQSRIDHNRCWFNGGFGLNPETLNGHNFLSANKLH